MTAQPRSDEGLSLQLVETPNHDELAQVIPIGATMEPERTPPKGVSPEVFEAATNAVTGLLEEGRCENIKIGTLIFKAYDDFVEPGIFQQFRLAIRADERLKSSGKGIFKSVEVSDGIKPEKVDAVIQSFVDRAAVERPVDGSRVLGYARRAGILLNTEEVDLFFVKLSTDPRIRPEESGAFSVKATADRLEADNGSGDEREAIYSRSDIMAARRVMGTLTVGRLYGKQSKRLQNLTRGNRAVHPNKLQEAREAYGKRKLRK